MTPEERFWAKVDKGGPGGCWLWTAGRLPSGYGTFWTGERKTVAHRVAYEWLVGPIPDGLQLDHVKARGCEHRHCVNPAHLEPVTCQENVLRGRGPAAVHAAKTHCPAGHEYSGRDSEGSRTCAICHRDRERERWRAAHPDRPRRVA